MAHPVKQAHCSGVISLVAGNAHSNRDEINHGSNCHSVKSASGFAAETRQSKFAFCSQSKGRQYGSTAKARKRKQDQQAAARNSKAPCVFKKQ
jgi:hypothetical protein